MGSILAQEKSIKALKEKSQIVLVDLDQLTEMQKDLLNANDGDDQQAAKAQMMVQKDDELNQIKNDLNKATDDGANAIKNFNLKKTERAEEEETKKQGGLITKKRTTEEKAEMAAFLSGSGSDWKYLVSKLQIFKH